MASSWNLLLLLLVVAAVIPVAAGAVVSETGGPVPPEIATHANDWPLPNFDYNNSRFTTHSTINSTTISNLRLAWSRNITHVGTFGGAVSGPLILGDTVYLQDGKGSVSAINLKSGSLLWETNASETLVLGPNGPAVGWGKVFFARDVYNMTAVNATTGRVVWSRQMSHVPTTGMDIQPTVYDGMVYISTVPGLGDITYPPGGIGVIYALNQSTGNTVWNFSTVDSPDLWGHPDINSGGGCWYTPSIDRKSGVMFWGTGNPAPFVGTPEYPNGASRPGPNLYTNTLLALDHRNGTLQWFTQVIPHGLFDYDLQIPPILARAEWNGIDQDIVIAGGKMGRVYGFNRSTGAILWETVVGKHQNDQLAALPPGFTQVYPGAPGGIETPMAYADGVVYAPYNNVYENWSPTAYYSGNVTPYIQPYSEGTGGLVAIKTDTGQILWEKKFDAMDVAGATVVNDIVFTGTWSGTLYAFNRTTGDQVWTYQAPDRVIAWPAVANDTIVWPAGGGFRSNGTPSLIALRVGG